MLPKELQPDGEIKIRLFENKDVLLPVTRPEFIACKVGTIGDFDYGGKLF